MIHKWVVDCGAGAFGIAVGTWTGHDWMTILGIALILWRVFEAFVLEPLGIQWFGILRRNNDKPKS